MSGKMLVCDCCSVLLVPYDFEPIREPETMLPVLRRSR